VGRTAGKLPNLHCRETLPERDCAAAGQDAQVVSINGSHSSIKLFNKFIKDGVLLKVKNNYKIERWMAL
jgi:hypothetical protein